MREIKQREKQEEKMERRLQRKLERQEALPGDPAPAGHHQEFET